MVWVMLFTGILLGWVIEWIIDTYRYNRMVERLQNDHSQAIMDVTNRYETTIEQMRSYHEDQLADMQKQLRSDLNLAKVEYNTRLAEQTAAHRQELATNQQYLDKELQLIESQHRAELEERDTTYAEAKNILEEGYKEKVAQLALEHEQRLRDTGASLRAQYEEALEQQQISLREVHSAELDHLEIRIRSEYEDELTQAQQRTDEQASQLKCDFDCALEQHNAQHRNEIAVLKADYEQRIDELVLLSRSQLMIENDSEASSSSSHSAMSHIEPDDLTLIEGIGPKANNLLHNAGIHSYNDLAQADVDTLQNILDNAGSRFRLLTPSTWPQQASLAAEGNWDALERLKDKLDGGKMSVH